MTSLRWSSASAWTGPVSAPPFAATRWHQMWRHSFVAMTVTMMAMTSAPASGRFGAIRQAADQCFRGLVEDLERERRHEHGKN